MDPDISEMSYPSQILNPSQEPINETISQDELMDSMDSDKPNLTDVPKEVLFQDYLLSHWI